MLKSVFCTICLLCVCVSTFAQKAAIIGTVTDQSQTSPIEFSTIALFRLPDSTYVTGTTSDAKGKFILNEIPEGNYWIKIQFLGYKPQVLSPIILAKNQKLDVGMILLQASEKLLDEITITGQKAAVYHQLDKQVYNARQFQSATGGTATDILKNLPSVSVDAQGGINVRGSSGFLVLLNGKAVQGDPTQILNQLPANAIENVEIITAPSAKYDADGKSGIINITTKAGTDDGISLTINTLSSPPNLRDYNNKKLPVRFGADATVLYKKGKWDASAGVSYLRNDLAGRRMGDVNTTLNNIYTSFPSVGERSFDKYLYSSRATLGFTPNKTHAFRAGFYHGIRTEYRLADIDYTNTKTDLSTGNTIGRINYYNSNLVKKRGEFTIANLDYTHAFANQSSLSLSGLYEHDVISGFTRNINLAALHSTDTLQYTLTTTQRPLTGYRLKADFQQPLAGGKLESGYQYRSFTDDGDFVYTQQDGNGEPLRYFPDFSGNVRVKNLIHSLYTQYAGTYQKKLTYTAGLRYEYATRRLTTSTPNSTPNTLTLSNLFPSVNVLYTASDAWQWKTGYSRRVQRNNSLELNPLPEREHSETLEQGDPNLRPEFVNLVELGVIHPIKNGSVFATLYYQGIENIVNRVNKVYADTILSRIYTNAGNARRWGLELGLDVKPTSWWKIYVGSNVYDYRITGSLFNNAVEVNNASLIYSWNTNQTFQFSKTLTLQWTINYLSERVTAQGEDSRFYTHNLSLKKTFMKGRMAATLQWQNLDLGLLETNQQRITTRGRDFFTTTNYIYESDVIMLNFSFNINPKNRKAKFAESEFGEKEF